MKKSEKNSLIFFAALAGVFGIFLLVVHLHKNVGAITTDHLGNYWVSDGLYERSLPRTTGGKETGIGLNTTTRTYSYFLEGDEVLFDCKHNSDRSINFNSEFYEKRKYAAGNGKGIFKEPDGTYSYVSDYVSVLYGCESAGVFENGKYKKTEQDFLSEDEKITLEPVKY